jgi:uncharacterized glyoxalase superfamily protein PhnB
MPDPLEALRAPITPLAPNPAFAAELRRRISAALGTPIRRSEPMTDTITMTTQALTPYLCVRDAVAALAYYSEAFGAVEQMRVTGDDGRIGHCEFTIGAARFMMADEYPEIDVLSPTTLGGSGVALYLEVADVDDIHRRAVEAGATDLRPPADQTHGNRTSTIRDPFGHRWMLSQPVESLSLDEYAQRETAFTVTRLAQATGGPPKTVWPTLNYVDALAGIRFLVEVFGFEEAMVVTGADPTVVEHSQLRWPEGGGVMLGTANREGNVFSERAVGQASIYVVTDEPDPLYERVMAAGVELVRDMRDEDYGSRGFSVRDPEGNIWSFGTYRGE